uniref:Ankyrin-like protein n=1 Tax=Giardia intestinalis TaxID=5741 RepID=Q9XZJ0_GIAIN|nr:ankyrin-like protein [Giardia intestinalis]
MPTFSSQDWFHAISTRRHDVVSVHLKECAGKRNTFGETGLMCAVRQGDAETVKILAPKECGILSQTSHSTALMMACEADHAGLVEILAPFEHKDTMPDGKTAFMVAAHAGAINSINIMLKYGTREQDQSNRTALDYAVMSMKQGIVISLGFSGIFRPDDIRQAIRTAGECKNMFAPKLLRLALQHLTGQESDVPDLTFEVENLNKEIASFRTCLQEVMGEDRNYYLNTFNGGPEPSNLLISRFVDHMHRIQSQLEELASVTANSQINTSKGKTKTSAKKDKSNIYDLEEENAQLRTKAAALEYIIRSPVFKSHTGYNLTSEDICDRINAEMIENRAYIKELERQIKDMRAERQREMNQVTSIVGLKDDYEKALEKLQKTQSLLDSRTDQLKTYRMYMGEKSPLMPQTEPDFVFRQRTMRAAPNSATSDYHGMSATSASNKSTERRALTSHRSRTNQHLSSDSMHASANSSGLYDSTMADQSNIVREVTTVTTTTKTYSPNGRTGTLRDRSTSRSQSHTTRSRTELERTQDKDRDGDRSGDRSLTNSFGLDNSMRNMQAMSELSTSRRRRLRPIVDPTPNGSYHSFNTSRSASRDTTIRNANDSYGSGKASDHQSLYNSTAEVEHPYEIKTSFESHTEYDHPAPITKDVPREASLRTTFTNQADDYNEYTSRGTNFNPAHANPEVHNDSQAHFDPPSLLTSTSFTDRAHTAQPSHLRHEQPYSDPIYSAITDRNNSSLDRPNPWMARGSGSQWEDRHPRVL